MVTGTWRPISLILSINSFTLFGSFALVLIKGLLILSIGISNITGPPPPPLLLPEPPGGAPKQLNKSYENETKRIKTQFQLTERNREYCTVGVGRSKHGETPYGIWNLQNKICHFSSSSSYQVYFIFFSHSSKYIVKMVRTQNLMVAITTQAWPT